ncbi:hypothetical protein SK128_001747, partial [Halocaridina rubra]
TIIKSLALCKPGHVIRAMFTTTCLMTSYDFRFLESVTENSIFLRKFSAIGMPVLALRTSRSVD